MIVGGSKIGRTLAEQISQDYNVRLIDYNRPKAGHISQNLKKLWLYMEMVQMSSF